MLCCLYLVPDLVTATDGVLGVVLGVAAIDILGLLNRRQMRCLLLLTS